jgi:NTE family protein
MESIEGGTFDSGDLLALVDRVMDIAVNEILNADIREVMAVNQHLSIQAIRPPQPLTIDIQNFTKMDIRRLLELGYSVGQEIEF